MRATELTIQSDPTPGAAPCGAPESGAASAAWTATILASAVWKIALAALLTRWVLVDDAYITLRYAKNAVERGELVYNSGEPVFGVTAPLWAFVTSGLYALFGGGGVEMAVLVLGVALWSLGAWIVGRSVSGVARPAVVGVFLLAPSFVDNQMLGMETPLFVVLALGAMAAAAAGRARLSAVCAGFLLVTRPEGVLLAPFLLYALARSRSGSSGGPLGAAAALRRLASPSVLALLLGPGLAWTAFALHRYGSVLPQSMVAKSGWSSDHYESLFSLVSALLTVPRLTFLPFVDYLPRFLSLAVAAATLAAVAWVLLVNVVRGTERSRAWLGFYLLYLAFYLAGMGATEASWYSVPSSVALLLAAEPALPRFLARPRPATALVLAVLLATASTFAVARRAPLLHSYEDGYGACAELLDDLPEAQPPEDHRVVIGEIGVFGYRSRHPIVDVGALVSPEVLPLKSADASFVSIVRDTGASFFVISEVALERNAYPSVGKVWRDDGERSWLEDRCRLAGARNRKLVYRVTDAPDRSAPGARRP